MASVRIDASFGDGTTLQQFSSIIQDRMKWMNETARDSVAACAITALKSIRTATKVAKPSGIKVDVLVDATLTPSYSTQGGAKIPCVRFKGSMQRYAGDEKVAFADKPLNIDKWLVFRFEDKFSKDHRKYLIVSPSMAMAKRKAKDIVSKRQKRYAGLARRAVGILMYKTVTKFRPNDNVPMRVTALATKVTTKRENVTKSATGYGGNYSLTLTDALRYALDAIRGGKAVVDTQLKKAMNKIVATINRKIPDFPTFFGVKKLDTPFAEVTRRRNTK